MLYVVGIGPGDIQLITVKGLETIKKCQVISGWESDVDRFSSYLEGKEVIKITKFEELDYKLEETFNYAKSTDTAFLHQGDIAVSARLLLEKIKKGCERYNITLELVPGVSSIIRALHVTGKDLSEVVFLTFHGRGNKNYDDIAKFLSTGRGLLIIPDLSSEGVKNIALKLKEIGHNDHVLMIMEKLTYPDETIHYYTVNDVIIKDLKFNPLSTMVYVPPYPSDNQ